MKKLLGIVIISFFLCNTVYSNESKYFIDYKNKLIESAIKQDLKKIDEICANYKSEKEKTIFKDETEKMRLDWFCEGSLTPIYITITDEYSKKLLDESLSHIDLCNEYKKIPLNEGEYDQMGFNTHVGIMNYCETIELRADFKQEAKNNLIKDLDLEKLNFNLLSNKYYSILISEKVINKKASCFLNLKKEKRLNYLKIKQRCGVNSIFYQQQNPNRSDGELISYELTRDSELKGNWIIITDYFYADANEDDYMDLVIRFKNDGSYSMAAQTMTTIVTALKKNEFKNINYSE